ncbi:MAG: hypothetical protein FJ102_00935 [Deltaproteobacteria bacterium]|nr:hypothetical protein [Deltaproteobacteria bacterium]
MKKLLMLMVLAAPTSAFAGFGATAHMTGLSDGTGWSPSLDWRQKGVHVNLQAIDIIDALGDDELNLGAGFAIVAAKRTITPQVEGTLSPGLALRYYSINGDVGDAMEKAKMQRSGFNLVGQFRMGMEMKEKMGFGVYVVPQLGVTNLKTLGGKEDDSEIKLVGGGGLEVSAWFVGN